MDVVLCFIIYRTQIIKKMNCALYWILFCVIYFCFITFVSPGFGRTSFMRSCIDSPSNWYKLFLQLLLLLMFFLLSYPININSFFSATLSLPHFALLCVCACFSAFCWLLYVLLYIVYYSFLLFTLQISLFNISSARYLYVSNCCCWCCCRRLYSKFSDSIKMWMNDRSHKSLLFKG